MKLEELIKKSTIKLQKNNIHDYSIKLKIIIEYFFNIPINKIIVYMNKEVSSKENVEFEKILQKVINGIPVQYITNKQEFMGLKFYVDKNVLIPQPDTEILVEHVIEYCNNINYSLKILDLCTGSGAIAISLAKYIKNANIYATDISENAIEIANKNAKINKVGINFIKSDMFENIEEKDFDIIVSNPPYIKTSVISTLSNEVKNEPYIALDGGKDGLKFYNIIYEKAEKYMNRNGIIFLEIGYDQKENIMNIFKKKYREVYCLKDLNNNDRVIIVKGGK